LGGLGKSFAEGLDLGEVCPGDAAFVCAGISTTAAAFCADAAEQAPI